MVEKISNRLNNITVKINGIESTNYTLSGSRITVENIYQLDTVIEISWSSYDILTSDQGVFHVADTHVYNSQNEWLATATFGDLQAHIKSQMTNTPGFSGNYFGDNNYTSLPQVHEFGGTIRQQPFSTELLAVTLDSADTNPFASLKFISNSYAKFRQQLIRRTSYYHYNQPIDVPIYKLVDMALDDLNLGKTTNSPFAYSNMLLYKDFKEVGILIVRFEFTEVWTHRYMINFPATHLRPLRCQVKMTTHWLGEIYKRSFLVWKSRKIIIYCLSSLIFNIDSGFAPI